MKIKLMTALAAMTAMAGVAGLPAHAQDVPTTPSTETTVATVSCDATSAADAAVVANWSAAEGQEAKLAVLRAALTPDAKRATCLVEAGASLAIPQGAVTNAGPRARLLQDILTVLNENPDANAALIGELVERYGDLLAAAASDVEPAAGDEGTDVTFGGAGDAPAENPNQLNTPADAGTPASPVVPLI